MVSVVLIDLTVTIYSSVLVANSIRVIDLPACVPVMFCDHCYDLMQKNMFISVRSCAFVYILARSLERSGCIAVGDFDPTTAEDDQYFRTPGVYAEL